jgi:lipopolysaccharide biosynthesis glycosyltransferase
VGEGEYVNQVIRIVVGYDKRESVAYHVFTQSALEKSSAPVSFIPLSVNTLKIYKETHADGSNEFIYSRFLTPFLMDFSGWAIFADGDMVCNSDIAELWALRDENKAVQVVKHNYKTKKSVKYLGNKNEDYPRKNWSSLILWNCGHPDNKILTPEFIQDKPGSFLHRFSWLDDSNIGELPLEWNWLAIEYPDNPNANIVHYTLGTPCFREYSQGSMADYWYAVHQRVNQGIEQI